MKSKKIIITICAATIFSSFSSYADNGEITVTVNGQFLVSDTPAIIVNDRTMLPMRSIFEALGAEVTWIEEQQLIFASKGNRVILMQIGNTNMSIQKTDEDGIIVVPLDSAPFVYNERTMVPVRAAAEAFDSLVEWNGDTKTVTITG